MTGFLDMPAVSAGGVDIGDNIPYSLMLDSGASQYLSFTGTIAAGSTYSGSFKLGKMGTVRPIVEGSIKLNADNTFTAFGVTTSAKLRAPDGHYFFHVSNNGVYLSTGSSGSPMVNHGTPTVTALTNPRIGFDGTNYFDGYLANLRIQSGVTGTYTDTTRVSADTGQAVNKNGVSSYGAAGARLEFANSSALGTDTSGNGNHWNLNGGITSANQTSDTPTNNFAVLNPLWNYNGTAPVIQRGNLRGYPQSTSQSICASMPCPPGKLTRAEAKIISRGYLLLGIHKLSDPGHYTDWTYYALDGRIVDPSAAYPYTYASATDNDIIDIIVDRRTAGTTTLEFRKNGTSLGSPITVADAEDWAFHQKNNSSGYSTVDWSFGQRPFTYTLTGEKTLCTENLAEGTAAAPASFSGNASADGACIWCNGTPETATINGNAVTWGTHADRTAGGIKLRTSSSSYNASGSNTLSCTFLTPNRKSVFKYQTAKGNP